MKRSDQARKKKPTDIPNAGTTVCFAADLEPSDQVLSEPNPLDLGRQGYLGQTLKSRFAALADLPDDSTLLSGNPIAPNLAPEPVSISAVDRSSPPPSGSHLSSLDSGADNFPADAAHLLSCPVDTCSSLLASASVKQCTDLPLGLPLCSQVEVVRTEPLPLPDPQVHSSSMLDVPSDPNLHPTNLPDHPTIPSPSSSIPTPLAIIHPSNSSEEDDDKLHDDDCFAELENSDQCFDSDVEIQNMDSLSEIFSGLPLLVCSEAFSFVVLGLPLW
ncbi:hypothetical protein NE237_024597 [Protea cynaroides]|uniref:Uncharacterized protein n=1 Tax=Protea cynaroides TaxID=273540 RepID=A0A9Q0H069_9MAGN|nr:hypothetical protein NE237_024597 [Protea cynaroides]